MSDAAVLRRKVGPSRLSKQKKSGSLGEVNSMHRTYSAIAWVAVVLVSLALTFSVPATTQAQSESAGEAQSPSVGEDPPTTEPRPEIVKIDEAGKNVGEKIDQFMLDKFW